MQNLKIVWMALVAVAIIAIGGYFFPLLQSGFGGVTGETNYNTLGISGLKVGSKCNDSFTSTTANGCKSVAHLMLTTCSMIANNIAVGTTSEYAYCTGVTGVTSADTIQASFSTSTLGFAFNDAWQIVSAKASTTAGVIDFQIIGVAGKAMSGVSQTGSTTVLDIFQ